HALTNLEKQKVECKHDTNSERQGKKPIMIRMLDHILYSTEKTVNIPKNIEKTIQKTDQQGVGSVKESIHTNSHNRPTDIQAANKLQYPRRLGEVEALPPSLSAIGGSGRRSFRCCSSFRLMFQRECRQSGSRPYIRVESSMFVLAWLLVLVNRWFEAPRSLTSCISRPKALLRTRGWTVTEGRFPSAPIRKTR